MSENHPSVLRVQSALKKHGLYSVITSGRHRVDTNLVAKKMGVERLHRADADFVRKYSGFAIGGVPPMVSAT
jgi:prolyl-tRNA editing enzyme YbaK/EbsC (Cys-tRNA(Pro) deacylase)